MRFVSPGSVCERAGAHLGMDSARTPSISHGAWSLFVFHNPRGGCDVWLSF